MSSAQPIEEFRKTLEDAGRQVGREIQESQRLQIDPSSIGTREKIVAESLENAKAYYKRKEYARAFNEWDRVCTALGGGEEFRSKIRALRDSHENLAKVNRELAEIKQILNQRAGPTPAEVKFVDGAHETVNGQVKNVYSYLSQQLRTARSSQTLSFWWPVALALVLLVAGAAGLGIYHDHAMRKTAAAAIVPVSAQAPGLPAGQAGIVEDAFAEAQKNVAEKQIAVLKSEHTIALEDARRKGAEAAKGDREKIVQLETELTEARARNSELERRVEVLTQDNLNKDRTINSLG